MNAKSELKTSRNYGRVYIENDKSQSERNAISNLKTIASVIGNDKVFVRGNRLVSRNDSRSDDTVYQPERENGEWQEVRHNRYRGGARSRGSTYNNPRDSRTRDRNDDQQYYQRSYNTRYTNSRNYQHMD